MRANGLDDLWNAGNCALNAWLSIGSSYSAEVFAHLPYDSVTVDLQHGMFGFETAVSMLQAISTTSSVPMVRVPANQSSLIQKVLDAGAYGIICPMIDTAEQCEAFVRATLYPPSGERSFGPARGLLYGGSDYLSHANETVLSWAMIETESALRNLESIVRVRGLSGIYIGPSDLSMTIAGKVETPLAERVTVEIARVISVARAHDLKVGIFCPDVAFARDMIRQGCHLVTVMNDVGLIRKATFALTAELQLSRPVAARSDA